MKNHLDIVDDHRVEIERSKKGKGNDLKIVFLNNNRPYISKIYRNILPDTEELIMEKLEDLISFNKDCLENGDIHRTIDILTIIDQIEYIISEMNT